MNFNIKNIMKLINTNKAEITELKERLTKLEKPKPKKNGGK